jgi:type I restriction enzyme S subunit
MIKFDRYSFSEVLDVRDGTHDSPKYVDDGYPLITSKNLDNGKIDFNNVNFITEADFITINKRSKVDVGDILYSMIGSIGNFATVNSEVNFAIKNVALFKFKDQKLSNKYLLYFIQSNEFTKQINSQSKGGTQKFVTLKILRNIQIPLPPLPQQQKIANILDAADALRQKDKALLAKYDELTQALFLDMFGDPVSNPKGWEKVRFDELVSNNCPLTYGIVQPGDEFENGVPCVRPVDLIYKYINIENLKRIDPVISNKFKRTLLKGGELLLSVRGSVGIISIANKSLKDSNVTRGIVPIWFDSDVSNKLFFYHLYNTMEIQRKVKNLAKGATLIQINLKDLRELKIIKPPIKLQNQFAERMQVIEHQKAIAQKSLEKSEQLFNSLLQKAFKEELL